MSPLDGVTQLPVDNIALRDVVINEMGPQAAIKLVQGSTNGYCRNILIDNVWVQDYTGDAITFDGCSFSTISNVYSNQSTLSGTSVVHVINPTTPHTLFGNSFKNIFNFGGSGPTFLYDPDSYILTWPNQLATYVSPSQVENIAVLNATSAVISGLSATAPTFGSSTPSTTPYAWKLFNGTPSLEADETGSGRHDRIRAAYSHYRACLLTTAQTD